MQSDGKFFTIKPGHSMAFGVTEVPDGVQFSIYLPDEENCVLKLYKKGHKTPQLTVDLTDEFKWGSVYFVTIDKHPQNKDPRAISEILSDDYEYMYESSKGEFIDYYAAKIEGRDVWGVPISKEKQRFIRGGISLRKFDWQDDMCPRRPFEDVVMYQLHVRGYTKHSSSKVKNKGTFDGLTEKISYIKDLGVNAVILLPCYEFDEVLRTESYGEPSDFFDERYKIEEITDEKANNRVPRLTNAELGKKLSKTEKPQVKLNYWGYGSKSSYYFAPKTSYAKDHAGAPEEMKTMVREFHKNDIEVLMDIYFTPGTNITLMTDCLRHWVLEYHIDGFRINDEVLPSIIVASDPILSGVKILTSHWDADVLKKANVVRNVNAFAEYNEGFMNDTRKFLKSDEGMIGAFISRFYRNPKEYSIINFITHVNGFSLMDLVSYDIKHNESNGEFNTDGTDYNYSWNCGVEGPSRKKAIVSRRMSQIRNAFLMLLFSQGTPMIFAGDEFGNTQYGNNNAYCHDDKVTWLDWNRLNTYSSIHDYVKKLIEFRKKHPVLHQKEELAFMDRLGHGVPDISVHSVSAWRPDYSNYNRMLGILLNGDYVDISEKEKDVSIYIIYNMYWEPKYFDLPQLPNDKEWYKAVETYTGEFSEIPKATKKRKKRLYTIEENRRTMVPARSIVVFVGK